MDGIITLVVVEISLMWFAIKTYIKLQNVIQDNEHLKEKIAELKDGISKMK